MKLTAPVLLVFAGLFGFASCTRSTESRVAVETRPNSAKVVNLAIWSNYVSPELLGEFTKKTGIQVQLSNYSSNEELLAKLQAGASGYDVAVPSDYMVFTMSQLELVLPLDYSKIPNSKNIDSKFLKKNYDPTNRYSIPYDWGTTGIAINRSLFKGTLNSWKELFNNTELAGKFTLLDDAREVIGAALKSLGYSLNSKNPAELQKAKALLIEAKKRVKGFTSEPLMPLENSESPIAHVYMSDALQARRAMGGKIDYLVPQEGGTFWIDNLVIPKGALHTEEAHQLINFLLEPNSVVTTVKSVLVAPTNKLAMGLLPPQIQNDVSLFPKDQALSKCEMIGDLGETLADFEKVWTEVKAQ